MDGLGQDDLRVSPTIGVNERVQSVQNGRDRPKRERKDSHDEPKDTIELHDSPEEALPEDEPSMQESRLDIST